MDSQTCNRRSFMKCGGIGGAALAAGFTGKTSEATQKTAPNVLFIAIDDLRPELGCYDRQEVISPNIDRLADSGVLFTRAYCQVPVCGASRASLMTGVRPNRHRFIDYYARADEELPGTRTLNRFFGANGYKTVSLGKVYHHAGDDAEGWSVPPWRPKGGWSGRGYVLAENRRIADDRGGRGPSWECADVEDDVYADGLIAGRAIDELRKASASSQPFFIAAGFMKPHLPFVAPKRYWDMYARDDIDLADNPFRPEGAPDAALHNWIELRRYHGIPGEGPLPEELARTLIHGYLACVSYTDAQIGRVLNELDRLGLADNTIVVLWGDHGWQLGEHGLWCKHANFETSLHSPLIVRAPGYGGKRSNELAEFVDIYPTLADLCGLDAPEHLQGASLVPLMDNSGGKWKQAAFSRYFDGDSIRTDRWRYTEWNRETMPPGSARELKPYARMLYDHISDPGENVNVAEVPENREIVAHLSEMLHDGWRPVLDELR